jgi:hypothetical protein
MAIAAGTEQAIRVGQDAKIKIGDHIIVRERDVYHGDGSGHTQECTPYMAEAVRWGASWSEVGRMGYYLITAALPDGECLAAPENHRIAGTDRSSSA